MVTVKATQNADKRHIRLEVSGHAGQAEYGQDIVCSAVSILVYTLAQTLSVMDSSGYFTVPPHIRLESGEAVIEALCRDDTTYIDSLHMMFFAKTGFSLLQANHPEYIEFIVNEA